MAKATYLLRKAGELVKERRYQDAVEVYLQATETDSSDARAWFGLGVCLYKVDNLDVARIALERAQKMGYPRAEEALARVEDGEKRRAAEGKGAKATVAPTEARRRAQRQPAAAGEPPRPARRPEEQKLDLDRFLRIMLIENIETDRNAIAESIEGNIRGVEVKPADYGVSTSDTMSGTVRYDVAILDWDTAPDAAAGLIQILKIKRPALLVICLTERWDPETAVEVLEAGADYHLVKEPHFASAIPLIVAQWVRRDKAVELQHEARGEGVAERAWPDALNALDQPLMLIDADLGIARVNSAAARVLRKRNEDLEGSHYSTLLYGEDDPPESCPVLQVLEGADGASGDVTVDAAGVTLSLQAWPVRNAVGKTTRAIVLAREATGEEADARGLREREWLYRNLTERSSAGMAMVGPSGNVHYANRALCTALDMAEAEVVGRSVEGLVPSQQLDALHSCLTEAVERGESAGELALKRGDGTSAPARVCMGRFTTSDGTYVVLTVQPGPAAAGAATPGLEGGLDQLECGLVALDTDGCISWANGLACGLIGRERKDLVGRNYLNTVSADVQNALSDGPQFVQALRAAHESGQALQGCSITVGSEELNYWSTPVTVGSGGVARIEHFYQAGAARGAVPAPAGGQSLAGLVAAVPEMLFTADPSGRLTWCNPGAAETVGYGESQLLGMTLGDLVSEGDRPKLQDLVNQALGREEHLRKAELLMTRAGGARFWGELSLLAGREAPDDSGPVLRGFLRDVTDRKVTQAIRDIVSGGPPM
jgi:PAS domain S-box-containing protein